MVEHPKLLFRHLTLVHLQNGLLVQGLALAGSLLFFLSLHKRVGEYSERELDDKERPQDDPRDVEEARSPLVPAVLVKVHNVGPPLVGEHLKDGEHGLPKVVVAHISAPKVVWVLVPPVCICAPPGVAPPHHLTRRVVEDSIHRVRGTWLRARIGAANVDAWVPGPNCPHWLYDEGNLLALEARKHGGGELVVQRVDVAAPSQTLREKFDA
mmetsp:Transcript_27073/g.62761  ORF Transcript_27073/g.62761 Transcript_27073/m.62761 type:complete len:211 (+) Transcript_27073:4411-5043(+)